MDNISYILVPIFLIVFSTGFFKRKKTGHMTNSENKGYFEPSLIDLLRNDFKPSVLGIKATILLLFEQEMLFIEKKVVNLATPWAPDEQEIIQLSLTANANPDRLSRTEDFIVRWLMFTYGDGVHTNLTKVLNDLNDEEFIAVNNEMFERWKSAVMKTAVSSGLYTDKPLPYGLSQAELFKNVRSEEIPDIPSVQMAYGIGNVKKEEIKSLLSIFDQSL